MAKKRSKTKVEHAPDWARRVHPKLRMMLNADPIVNAFRANSTGAVFVTDKLDKQAPSVASVVTPEDAKRVDKLPKLNTKSQQRGDVMVNVFVETTEPVAFDNTRTKHGN